MSRTKRGWTLSRKWQLSYNVQRRQLLAAALTLASAGLVSAQAPAPTIESPTTAVLFQNVRIFNGRGDRLAAPSNVLVVGNTIRTISARPIALDPTLQTTVINGDGRTLMPGMIDAHAHVMLANLSPLELISSEIGYMNVVAVKTAEDMLMRGFTSIRDMGGPAFGLKRGIDRGLVRGPRIWPSGAMISQSGGHGDFRLPNELPARPGDFSYSERVGGAAIADSPDAVRQRARELLALGASQIKLMAGGGISSTYDPLDATQYTVPELRAAVEAAENWGTYVAVHAYTPRAIRQAIEAGVKVIEHGQLIDEPTAKLMADKGIWWSLQPFAGESRYAEGSPNRSKQLQMFEGTDTAYRLAKKYKIKVAWGADNVLDAAGTARQNQLVTRMLKWYSPAEILTMITAGNAQLLALSGERTPYPGKLGVIEEGALADLLVVDGDPIADLKLLEDPAKNLLVIVKDGRIYKSSIK